MVFIAWARIAIFQCKCAPGMGLQFGRVYLYFFFLSFSQFQRIIILDVNKLIFFVEYVSFFGC